MNPERLLRRADPASKYWAHSQRDPKPAQDELQRIARIAREQSGLSLTGQLMGDPPPSRSALAQKAESTPTTQPSMEHHHVTQRRD